MGLIGTQIGNSDNTTTAQIRAAVLTTTITNGDTTHAPDGNAVYDALQLKGDSQTAATQVARLALTGLTRGARVYQTDNGFWYELTNAAAPSDAASWQAQPKVYKANLTQNGAAEAPVATVFENTLSAAVVWTYGSTGAYVGTLAGAFLANKVSDASGVVPADQTMWQVKRDTDNTLAMSVFAAGDPIELGVTAFVEILVYP